MTNIFGKTTYTIYYLPELCFNHYILMPAYFLPSLYLHGGVGFGQDALPQTWRLPLPLPSLPCCSSARCAWCCACSSFVLQHERHCHLCCDNKHVLPPPPFSLGRQNTGMRLLAVCCIFSPASLPTLPSFPFSLTLPLPAFAGCFYRP